MKCKNHHFWNYKDNGPICPECQERGVRYNGNYIPVREHINWKKKVIQ